LSLAIPLGFALPPLASHDLGDLLGSPVVEARLTSPSASGKNKLGGIDGPVVEGTPRGWSTNIFLFIDLTAKPRRCSTSPAQHYISNQVAPEYRSYRLKIGQNLPSLLDFQTGGS
jgi:hypothetical protein